ncbi:hypothetical protein CIK05_01110 [Bdellovibrio sp. qaytius]|nr:hypothetical protein CIK05_01110 [Bdellovibrio sp. qaytius]
MKKIILLIAGLLMLSTLTSCMPKCGENEELKKSGLTGKCEALVDSVVATTIPTAPSSLTATRDGTAPTTTINLSWADNSADESGFNIERSLNNVTFTSMTVTAASSTSYADSSASQNTLYYYRVSSVNSAGSSSYTAVASAQTARSFKYLFVSASTPAANMIGATNSDSICNADANRPDTSVTYKTLIAATNGTAQSRTACTSANCSGGASEHTRWVLAVNTEYRRADATTVIGTTNNAGLFTFPLTNSFGTCGGGAAWGGFANDWTSAVNSCGGWTFGGVSNATLLSCTDTSSTALDKSGQTTCATSHNLICVEQ